MASFHDSWSRYDAMDRPSWADHVELARAVIPEVEVHAHSELDVVELRLSSIPESSTRLIHFDMEADNMRWRDRRPTVFDFDDAARYPFAADVAFACRDLFGDRVERIDLADSRIRAMVRGYRSRRAISDEALAMAPIYVRMHNLFWFARIEHALGEGGAGDEPAWTAQLRARLVEKLAELREGFENHPVAQVLA